MDICCSELQAVMGLARGEAIHLQHNYLGTEHLLLGILCESAGIAWEVLKSSNITLDQARRSVEDLIGMGPQDETPHFLATDRARKVMAFAADSAIQYGNPAVEPEHLLLGIVREGQGVAANVLINLQAPLRDIQFQLSARLERGDANP